MILGCLHMVSGVALGSLTIYIHKHPPKLRTGITLNIAERTQLRWFQFLYNEVSLEDSDGVAKFGQY